MDSIEQRLKDLEARVKVLESTQNTGTTYKQILHDKQGRMVLVFDEIDHTDGRLIYARETEASFCGWHVSNSDEHEEFLSSATGWTLDQERSLEYIGISLIKLSDLFEKAKKEVGA